MTKITWTPVILLALVLSGCYGEGDQMIYGGGDSSGDWAEAYAPEPEFDHGDKYQDIEIDSDQGSSEWEMYLNSLDGGGCPYGCNEHEPGCDIKGNINIESGEKIYHVPGQAYYDKTEIRPEYGERWFCNEYEADHNGWRKAME